MVFIRFGTQCGGLHKNLLFFSVSEANTVYSRSHGRKAVPDPQLEFCRKLALGMFKNNLDDEGVIINSLICRKKRSRGTGSSGHDLVSRPTHTEMWNTGDNEETKKKTEYVKIKCDTCKTNIKTYCNFNKEGSYVHTMLWCPYF